MLTGTTIAPDESMESVTQGVSAEATEFETMRTHRDGKQSGTHTRLLRC